MEKLKYVWQICDGKRGHENQSTGLLNALKKHLPIEIIRIDAVSSGASWIQAFAGAYPAVKDLPRPAFVVGAGSRTHSTLLACSRCAQVPSVLIMSPPRGLTHLFDLCVIPEHDQRTGANILRTKGAMNLITPNTEKDGKRGLILVGGPSKHHDWASDELIAQISHIIGANSEINWSATTSRRTPDETSAKLEAINSDQFSLTPVEATDATWLPTQLSQSAYVWVTEDSVSMVYEALSSGAIVGVLPVPRKSTDSRVIKGIDQLAAENRVNLYNPNHADLNTNAKPAPLNEASRIAGILHKRYFSEIASG